MFIDRFSTHSINSQHRYPDEIYSLLCLNLQPGLSIFMESCQKSKDCFFFSFFFFPLQRSQKTPYLMSLFVAGRKAVCAIAQIIGGGFSAGEDKLKVTPGWKARHDAVFLSALQLKLQTLYGSTGARVRARWREEHREPLTDPNTDSKPPPPPPPINLSYPRLNMSRVDVTLRLCQRQTESVCVWVWVGGCWG